MITSILFYFETREIQNFYLRQFVVAVPHDPLATERRFSHATVAIIDNHRCES